MPFDANGNFTRNMNWQDDAANDIPILASRHDDEDDNFANGFNNTVCRDGRAAMTGALKMGGYKVTGMADGTASTDAVTKSQLDAQNVSLTAAISTAISNMLSTQFPVGSVYWGTQGTCPMANLIVGSTWTKIATKIVTDVSSTVAVKGTGKTLGMTNGSKNVGLVGNGAWDANARLFSTDAYNVNVNTGVGSAQLNNGMYGVVTDSTKSGLTGVATSTTLTINIWKRTA